MRIADGFGIFRTRQTAGAMGWFVALMFAGATVVFAGESSDKEAEATASGPSSPDDDEIAQVLGLSDDVEWGEYLAGECATCHGAPGGEGSVPIIHGIDARYIVRALLEYRSGLRSNASMVSVAGALNDEEVAVLAHYLAQAVPQQ